MAHPKHKPGEKLYRVTVEGEYYTHSNGGRDRVRFEDIVMLTESIQEFGYLYACKTFITDKYKEEHKEFRRLRTCKIKSAVLANNPTDPIEEIDLMSYTQLIDHATLNAPGIKTELYFSHSQDDELRQAIKDYKQDPSSALKHQEWKQQKSQAKVTMHSLLRQANQKNEASL